MTKPDGQLNTAKSKSKVVGTRKQLDRPMTLDEGLARFTSTDKVSEIDTLLKSIKVIDFHLEQTPNRMFDITLHLVISTRAAILVGSGLVGAIILALKLLAH